VTAIAAHPVPHKGDPVTVQGLYITRAAACGLRVPAWVPHCLIAEYVDCASEYGAEHAEKHVRKVKLELGLDD
jgi:hypothetical protein